MFNAGVPGYDTVQEAAVLRRLVPIVRPHVVIVTWLSNDASRLPGGDSRVQVLDGYLVDDMERYQAWRDGIDHRGVYRSSLYRFVRVRWRLFRDRIGLRRRSWSGEIDPEDFSASAEALAEIQALADELDARTVLVPLPRREQVEGSAPLSDLEYVARVGRSRGIQVVELVRAWRQRGVEAREFFLNDNVHLTASGYREVAEAVAAASALRGSLGGTPGLRYPGCEHRPERYDLAMEKGWERSPWSHCGS